MMFGIVFQEYFESKKNKDTYLHSANRFLWVTASMLLVMAFCGNLKASLMVNNYYDQTKSVTDLLEKDMTVHATFSFCALLTTTAPLSPLRNALLQQTKKENSQVIHTR